jgi:hypothetical protein
LDFDDCGAALVLSGRAVITVGDDTPATVGPGELIAPRLTGAAEGYRVVAQTALQVLGLDQRAVVALLHEPSVATAILRAATGADHG